MPISWKNYLKSARDKTYQPIFQQPDVHPDVPTEELPIGFGKTLQDEVPHLLSLFDGLIDCVEHNETHSSLTKKESDELVRVRIKMHLARLQLTNLLDRQARRFYIEAVVSFQK